jgi:hypothetical protein
MPAASTESFSISANFLDLVVASPQSPWLQKEDNFCIITFCVVMGQLDEKFFFLIYFLGDTVNVGGGQRGTFIINLR